MKASAIAALIPRDRAGAGDALDLALRRSHGSGDPSEMLALHQVAVEYWGDDADRAAFHRTHAYVYALEAGDWAAVDALRTELAAEGRI
jgi:hypothetical protein